MKSYNDSFVNLRKSAIRASDAFDRFVYALRMFNSTRSNNWLKMHGYPKRRKNGTDGDHER